MGELGFIVVEKVWVALYDLTIYDILKSEDSFLLNKFRNLVCKISRKNALLLYFMVAVLHLLLIVVPAYFYGFYVRDPRGLIPSTLDYPCIFMDMFACLFFSPVIWTFFTYQPIWLKDAFNKLAHDGVIFEQDMVEYFVHNRKANFITDEQMTLICLAITVILEFWWLTMITPVDKFWYFNRYDHPFYFWFFFFPQLFFSMYLLIWSIFRQGIILYITYYNYFKTYNIKPIPYHIDKFNGLAPIGKYYKRIAWAVVFFLAYIAQFIIAPGLFGYATRMKADNILMLFVFIVLTIIFVVLPLRQIYLKMLKEKGKVLSEIVTEINLLIIAADAISSIKIRILVEKYNLLDKEYKTWPFYFIKFTLLPILANLALLMMNTVKAIDFFVRFFHEIH